MIKKGIKRKEIEGITSEKQNKGLTKQEIYNELKEMYFDKNRLAIIIASTVNIHRKNKFKSLNLMLMILVSLAALIKVTVLFSLTNNLILVAFSITIALLINFWFVYQIYRYRPFIYSYIGFLILFQEIRYLLEIEFISNWGVFEMIFYLFVAVFSIIVKEKLFPKFGLFRPEKDKKGNVIFD